MIRFVHNEDIDRRKWDETVLKSQFPTVFATFEILSLAVAPDRWHALVLDDYAAVMPLPTRRKFLFCYAFHPYFVPQLGIFSKIPCTESLVSSFLEHIPDSYVLEEFTLNAGNAFSHNGSRTITYYELPLEGNYEDLAKGFSNNTRRNIKDGEKHGLTLGNGTCNIGEIITLFRNNRGRDSHVGFTDSDYARLATIAHHLSDSGLCETWSVFTRDGRLAAGALFVRDGGRLWFWFSGRDNRLSSGKPMFFLIDRFIRHHANSGLTLDFNGSTNPDVARMYRGFGSAPYSLTALNIYKNPFWKAAAKLNTLPKNKGRHK